MKKSIDKETLDSLVEATMGFREAVIDRLADLILPIMQSVAAVREDDIRYAYECAAKTIAVLAATGKGCEDLAQRWIDLFGFTVEIHKLKPKATEKPDTEKN